MSCDNYLAKNKIPLQVQANNLQLCLQIEELEGLCPIGLMLVSQIINFMSIIAKVKGAQYDLKEQCVLVPADLKMIHTVWPRSCDVE